MKSILKRAIIFLHCCNLLSAATTTRLFARFDLWSA